MAKLIVIEGTDCSGKETQSKLLIKKLKKDGINVIYFSFPNYDSPTGKIVGGPYLGKKNICEGWFPEGAPNVDAKVSSLYYAADRRYNKDYINEQLDKGINIVLDRSSFSNFAHQGGKIRDKKERKAMYDWLEKLEFKMLEIPKMDIGVFIHMPYEQSLILKSYRKEEMDQNEQDKDHLMNAELAYMEIAELYDFKTIKCSTNGILRKEKDINNEIYEFVKGKL